MPLQCHSSCLKCTANSVCTDCAAKTGLSPAQPQRCVPCADARCFNCEKNYKRCIACATQPPNYYEEMQNGLHWRPYYVDAKGRCQLVSPPRAAAALLPCCVQAAWGPVSRVRLAEHRNNDTPATQCNN